jgi:hypothetical protein
MLWSVCHVTEISSQASFRLLVGPIHLIRTALLPRMRGNTINQPTDPEKDQFDARIHLKAIREKFPIVGGAKYRPRSEGFEE